MTFSSKSNKDSRRIWVHSRRYWCLSCLLLASSRFWEEWLSSRFTLCPRLSAVSMSPVSQIWTKLSSIICRKFAKMRYKSTRTQKSLKETLSPESWILLWTLRLSKRTLKWCWENLQSLSRHQVSSILSTRFTTCQSHLRTWVFSCICLLSVLCKNLNTTPRCRHCARSPTLKHLQRATTWMVPTW